MALFNASRCYAISSMPNQPLSFALDSVWNSEEQVEKHVAPKIIFKTALMEDCLKKAYQFFTKGQFASASKAFTQILLDAPFLVVETRQEAEEVKEIVSIAKDYLIALRVQGELEKNKANPTRSAELSAYFTHCKLQKPHLGLALNQALTAFYKIQNYNTCASFCRRLVELSPPAKMMTKARQVLAVCEKNPSDAHSLNYDPRNPFDVCTLTFQPIYRGNKFSECPYTGAKFDVSCEGQVSPIGNIAKIGAIAVGLTISEAQIRN